MFGLCPLPMSLRVGDACEALSHAAKGRVALGGVRLEVIRPFPATGVSPAGAGVPALQAQACSSRHRSLPVKPESVGRSRLPTYSTQEHLSGPLGDWVGPLPRRQTSKYSQPIRIAISYQDTFVRRG